MAEDLKAQKKKIAEEKKTSYVYGNQKDADSSNGAAKEEEG